MASLSPAANYIFARRAIDLFRHGLCEQLIDATWFALEGSYLRDGHRVRGQCWNKYLKRGQEENQPFTADELLVSSDVVLRSSASSGSSTFFGNELQQAQTRQGVAFSEDVNLDQLDIAGHEYPVPKEMRSSWTDFIYYIWRARTPAECAYASVEQISSLLECLVQSITETAPTVTEAIAKLIYESPGYDDDVVVPRVVSLAFVVTRAALA